MLNKMKKTSKVLDSKKDLVSKCSKKEKTTSVATVYSLEDMPLDMLHKLTVYMDDKTLINLSMVGPTLLALFEAQSQHFQGLQPQD